MTQHTDLYKEKFEKLFELKKIGNIDAINELVKKTIDDEKIFDSHDETIRKVEIKKFDNYIKKNKKIDLKKIKAFAHLVK